MSIPLKANYVVSLLCAAFWGLVVKVATRPFLGNASFIAAAVTMVVCYFLTFLVVACVQVGAEPQSR